MKKIWGMILALIFLPIFCLAADMVDINSASLEQLETLTGIGPVKAQAIIDTRPYSSVDDLDRAKGIGPATLQKIKDQGLACVNCAQPTSGLTYSPGVFFNEILPNPKGPDETDEWLELYNSNQFDVNLSGWQIKDSVGTVTIFTVPQNTEILANGFLVFKRPDTNIMLNNDQDSLVLLWPDGKIVDTAAFSSAPLDQSLNRTVPAWKWSATLTPGAANIITAVAETPSTSSGPSGLPKTQKTDINSKLAGAGLLSANENIDIVQENANPWFLFFVVLAATIILAGFVLFIKFKFKTNVGT